MHRHAAAHPGAQARVTTGAEAAARDRAAIAAGTPSFELLLRAGTAAAAFILREYGDRLAHGVALFAGSGNNGGDAYVVAAQLARAGVKVRLHATAPPRTEDATRAHALANRALQSGAPNGTERVVVDGVLGTGHRGPLRSGVENAALQMRLGRDRGAAIVALDVPSGLDAGTGEIAEGSVPADCTLCFGSVKRGVLLQRAHAGRIVVLDIGLRNPIEPDDRAWLYASESAVAAAMPTAPWNAHKGTRGHLALVGGAAGMAGAIVLATRAALASGCGLARAFVEAPGVPALQHGAPQAIARAWPAGGEHDDQKAWGHALAIGPGLGRSPSSRALLERALRENGALPVVMDADALTLASMSGGRDPASLISEWGQGREQVVLTPHAGEFARLTGAAVPEGWSERADALVSFAIRARVTVLLKGTPTLIATPDGTPPTVVARGNQVLATGGSGDMLTGIIGALLAGGADARQSAILGATAHGLAAEIAAEGAGGVRGVTLEAVQSALPQAWRRMAHPATFEKDILSELPAPVT